MSIAVLALDDKRIRIVSDRIPHTRLIRMVQGREKEDKEPLPSKSFEANGHNYLDVEYQQGNLGQLILDIVYAEQDAEREDLIRIGYCYGDCCASCTGTRGDGTCSARKTPGHKACAGNTHVL